ncbi:ERF family protein [Flavobacteriaceae bacterium]|nr:ERF family protein [Flavobacteriaceae bacterium]
MSIINIQQKLKAKKGQRNAFGNYNYRSAEDILESVKPLLAEAEMYLTISDSLEYIGDRYYIKATAVVRSADNHFVAEATGYARESESRKGMDVSQITGATSSYARKYALNGLFAIDDGKDADSRDNTKEDSTETEKPWFTESEFESWHDAMKDQIDSKTKTVYQVIASLKKKYKLSPKIVSEIKQMAKV